MNSRQPPCAAPVLAAFRPAGCGPWTPAPPRLIMRSIFSRAGAPALFPVPAAPRSLHNAGRQRYVSPMSRSLNSAASSFSIPSRQRHTQRSPPRAESDHEGPRSAWAHKCPGQHASQHPSQHHDEPRDQRAERSAFCRRLRSRCWSPRFRRLTSEEAIEEARDEADFWHGKEAAAPGWVLSVAWGAPGCGCRSHIMAEV